MGVDATFCDIMQHLLGFAWVENYPAFPSLKKISHVPEQTRIGFSWRYATYFAAKSCKDFLILNVKMGNRGISFAAAILRILPTHGDNDSLA
jgi:hypothetical protein